MLSLLLALRNFLQYLFKMINQQIIKALFLGTSNQSYDFFQKIMSIVIKNAAFHKNNDKFYKNYVQVQKIADLQNQERKLLQKNILDLLSNFQQKTNPSFSPLYLAHILKQPTLASIIGNFIGTLYQNNNVGGSQGSPATQPMQIKCLQGLAKMFQYPNFKNCYQFSSEKVSWGHFTSGGTVANFQAFWAIRSIKYVPLTIKLLFQFQKKYKNISKRLTLKRQTSESLIKSQIQSVKQHKPPTQILFQNLSYWQLLNLKNQQIFLLLDKIVQEMSNELLQVSNQTKQKAYVYQEFKNDYKKYGIENLGFIQFYQKLKQIQSSQLKTPIIIASGAKHYSIVKCISALGLGTSSIKTVQMDQDYRMCISSLRQMLNDCLQKKIPILSVLSIFGTTQFSSIDDLSSISSLREQFAQKGLYFSIHCDAAYGGYFKTLDIPDQKFQNNQNSLSEYSKRQLESFKYMDSITIDPHKNGYSILGIGAIIYKNHKIKNFINFSAKYLESIIKQPYLSVYGLEGTKSGAIIASVYLAQQTAILNRHGHGQILQNCLMKTKIYYAKLKMFNQTNKRFKVVMTSRSHSQKNKNKSKDKEKFNQIASMTVNEIQAKLIHKDKDFCQQYLQSGPDLNIIVYGFNFVKPLQKECTTATANKSLKMFNMFNNEILKICQANVQNATNQKRSLIFSRSIVPLTKQNRRVYQNFLSRAQLDDDLAQDKKQIVLIRSTIMNPLFLRQSNDEVDVFDRVFQQLQATLSLSLQKLEKEFQKRVA